MNALCGQRGQWVNKGNSQMSNSLNWNSEDTGSQAEQGNTTGSSSQGNDGFQRTRSYESSDLANREVTWKYNEQLEGLGGEVTFTEPVVVKPKSTIRLLKL